MCQCCGIEKKYIDKNEYNYKEEKKGHIKRVKKYIHKIMNTLPSIAINAQGGIYYPDGCESNIVLFESCKMQNGQCLENNC